MNKIRVVFFGSGSFSVGSLERLHQDTDILVHSIVTKRDKKVGRGEKVVENIVAKKGKNLNIPVLKVGSLLKNPSQLDSIDWSSIDYAVIVSFGYILSDDILCQLPEGFINLHPSLLPKYRGPSPIHTSILNGDPVAGNSIMLLEKEVDSGPILSQEKIKINSNETIEDVYSKLSKKGADLLVKTIKDFNKGKIIPKIQDHTKATYTKMIKKEDGFTTFREPDAEIYNKYRAYCYWPGLYTTVTHLEKFLDIQTNIKEANKVVKLKDISYEEDELKINKLQLPNKPEIYINDFMNGYVID